MALPVVVTFLSQIIVLYNELSEFGVSLQSVKDLNESLGGDIVSFDFQRLDSTVLLQKQRQFSSTLIPHESVINHNSRLVSERLE